VSGKRQAIAGAAAGAVLVVILVVGIGLGWLNGSSTTSAPPAKRLAVRALLSPYPAFYGDVLTAEIDVTIDAAKVSSTSLRVVPSFDPYVETGPPRVSDTRAGHTRVLSYVYSIQCVSDGCLPLAKPYALELPALTVTATAGTQQLSATATWPTTFIASRLTAKDIARTRFRWSRVLPAPVYAVAPGTLAALLTVAAGLLAFTALGLAGFELLRLLERRRRLALVALTPLEAALAYTRDAARRPDPADRRKALGLLAKTLGDEGVSTLAGATGDVAWSEEPPSPDRALELADEVETTAKGER
jgi:hypothetical protein